MDLSLLWDTEISATLPTSTGAWDEIIHQLTAQSVITDFENMAEKETDIEVERGLIRIRVKNKNIWILNQVINSLTVPFTVSIVWMCILLLMCM